MERAGRTELCLAARLRVPAPGQPGDWRGMARHLARLIAPHLPGDLLSDEVRSALEHAVRNYIQTVWGAQENLERRALAILAGQAEEKEL